MTKLEKFSAQFCDVLNYIEMAEMKLKSLPAEIVAQNDLKPIFADLLSVYNKVEDEMYMALAPLEMEEEEKQEEIRVLERRLAELKSSL